MLDGIRELCLFLFVVLDDQRIDNEKPMVSINEPAGMLEGRVMRAHMQKLHVWELTL